MIFYLNLLHPIYQSGKGMFEMFSNIERELGILNGTGEVIIACKLIFAAGQEPNLENFPLNFQLTNIHYPKILIVAR